MENIKNKQILGIIAVTILAIIVGFYIYNDNTAQDTAGEESPTATSTETTNNTGINIEGDGDYTVEIVPVSNNLPKPPSLGRKIVFSDDTSLESRAVITANMDVLYTKIGENDRDISAWTELATYYKIANDYEGSREALEYVTKIAPNSSLAYRNLGDLYSYYIKDSVKAEKNFLKAIELLPSQVEYYSTTADFYRNVLGDTQKAISIIEQGIVANPNSPDLKTLKSN